MASFSSMAVVVLLAVSMAYASDLHSLVQKHDGLDALKETVKPEVLAKFVKFASQFNKTYSDAKEARTRLNNFLAASDLVDIRQANEQSGAVHGLTKFADFSPEEFKTTFMGARKPTPEMKAAQKANKRPTIPHNKQSRAKRATTTLPTAWDWRTYGVVTSIKDQGQCGDCFAFASMAAMESAYALAYGINNANNITNYSEAEVCDCTDNTQYGNYGCNGGWGYNVFDYILKKPGVTNEATYPYSDTGRGTCKIPNGSPRFATNMYEQFTPSADTEAAIQSDLYNYGPMYIAIDADPLQTYTSGILNPTEPSGGWDVNHAVSLIGWGVDSKAGPYWIAKNSWGTSWGESGFFRFVRGTNALDILNNPTECYFESPSG